MGWLNEIEGDVRDCKRHLAIFLRVPVSDDLRLPYFRNRLCMEAPLLSLDDGASYTSEEWKKTGLTKQLWAPYLGNCSSMMSSFLSLIAVPYIFVYHSWDVSHIFIKKIYSTAGRLMAVTRRTSSNSWPFNCLRWRCTPMTWWSSLRAMGAVVRLLATGWPMAFFWLHWRSLGWKRLLDITGWWFCYITWTCSVLKHRDDYNFDNAIFQKVWRNHQSDKCRTII